MTRGSSLDLEHGAFDFVLVEQLGQLLFRVVAHAAELVHAKLLLALADTGLVEKDRAPGVDLDQDRDDQKQR